MKVSQAAVSQLFSGKYAAEDWTPMIDRIKALEDQDAYRKTVMRETCGKESLNDLNTTTDFEKVMHRFSVDSGDFEAAANYAIADVRRLSMLVKIECCQIMQLSGLEESDAQEYLGGILDQSMIATNGRRTDTNTYWLDVAPQNVTKLLAMLDTHRRRLIRRLMETNQSADTLTFIPAARYTTNPYNRLAVQPNYYRDLPTLKVNVR